MSRKEQSNKKKLSPLTNHKNTKNGTIKGSFDRVNLFKQAAEEEKEKTYPDHTFFGRGCVDTKHATEPSGGERRDQQTNL